MNKKIFSVKNILLLVMYVVIVGILIAGNTVYFIFEGAVGMHLLGSGIKVDSDKAQQTLAKGDELVQEIAAEGIVLLENKNGTLPLSVGAGKYKVNLFGVGSTDDGFTYSGIGSGASTIIKEDIVEGGAVKFKRNRVTLREGLEDNGFEVNVDLLKKYESGNPDAKFYSDDQAILNNEIGRAHV